MGSPEGRHARGVAGRPSHARLALSSFHSPWFLIPQGTGSVALVLHQLDYRFRGLDTISVIFWVAAIALLAATCALYLCRLAAARPSPRAALRAVASDTSEAACLASVSVAFMSIVQMLALVVVPGPWGGRSWAVVVYVLWWVNCGLAVAACLFIPLIFVHSIHAEGGFINCLTPSTQLPLIAALTSAAGAGTLCAATASGPFLTPAEKVPMIIVAYLEVGLGLPLAIALDILFIARVLSPWETETGAEPLVGAQVFSEMVSCGPWGQTSFGLQALGAALLSLNGKLGAAQPGQTERVLLTDDAMRPLGYASMLVGLTLWGQGTFWWTFAVVSIGRSFVNHFRSKPPMQFAVSVWAIVFPWGVYTNAAVQLGKLLDSPAFRVWSTVLAIMLVIIWLACAAFTLKGVFLGTLLGHQKVWKRPSVDSANGTG
ncbi:hypothetical protein Purlil1_7742 [Purpureocillium lilacinum]|uniref:C4-dicarboxylate transporter/malic acid transport protein n=1 Tax=Purpureocillium lilacinum TaxID=33203 RepID=A0ABR0BV70_PURLI|nr:hypothetical protein Purlil1_7742 [Purpureocillium lilacinum]GJN76078.1 hypothetical protein PLICBS_010189 [Purpureocillium lilacinum]